MECSYNEMVWDSIFFGYKIAAIHPTKMHINELAEIVSDLQCKNFKLIYFFVNPDDRISQSTINDFSGVLVDEKVTFQIEISEKYIPEVSEFVKPYNQKHPSEQLISLALQSGAYSRFKIDNNFRNNEFKRLYTAWISNSVTREISDEVLVYCESKKTLGVITLSMGNKIGSIGLLAVDQEERGKSIGKNLIKAAFSYFFKNNISCVEVTTQLSNQVACGFYRSIGFEVKNITNIFHLWIK